MIDLNLNPADWPASTGEIHRRNAEGYPLAPRSIVLAAEAAAHGLTAELGMVLEFFIGAGTAENWILTRLQARQIATAQDADDEGEPVGDPRPVLEMSCTFVARPEHPDFAQIAGPRYDTLNSEALPAPARDALGKLYTAFTA